MDKNNVPAMRPASTICSFVFANFVVVASIPNRSCTKARLNQHNANARMQTHLGGGLSTKKMSKTIPGNKLPGAYFNCILSICEWVESSAEY